MESKKKKPFKIKTGRLYYFIWTIILTVYISAVFVVGFIYYLNSNGPYSFLEAGIALVAFIATALPIYKYWDKIDKLVTIFTKRYYRKKISNLQ